MVSQLGGKPFFTLKFFIDFYHYEYIKFKIICIKKVHFFCIFRIGSIKKGT